MVISFLLLFITLVDSIDWNKHHDNKEVLQILLAISDSCPNISKVYFLTYKSRGTENRYTPKGNLLPVIVFGKDPLNDRPGIPNFQYVGNMHGNEVVSRELLLHLSDYLCEAYRAGDPMIVKLLKITRIHILPSMNPDGWDISTSSKNPGFFGRQNAAGVDLNRNFPDLLRVLYENIQLDGPLDHLKPSINQLIGRQPETMMIIEWMDKVNFILSANIHGGDLVANYPYDNYLLPGKKGPEETADNNIFLELAGTYARYHPRMLIGKKNCTPVNQKFDGGIVNGADWYPIVGSMQDYKYLATNDYEITLELGCQKFPPASELTGYWEENKASLLNFIAQIHRGVSGQVFSMATQEPIRDAVIQVTNVTDPNNPKPIMHDIHTGVFGEFYRLLTKGTYIILARAKDHQDAVTCVTIDRLPTLDPKTLEPAKHRDLYLLPVTDDDTKIYEVMKLNMPVGEIDANCSIALRRMKAISNS